MTHFTVPSPSPPHTPWHNIFYPPPPPRVLRLFYAGEEKEEGVEVRKNISSDACFPLHTLYARGGNKKLSKK